MHSDYRPTEINCLSILLIPAGRRRHPLRAQTGRMLRRVTQTMMCSATWQRWQKPGHPLQAGSGNQMSRSSQPRSRAAGRCQPWIRRGSEQHRLLGNQFRGVLPGLGRQPRRPQLRRRRLRTLQPLRSAVLAVTRRSWLL